MERDTGHTGHAGDDERSGDGAGVRSSTREAGAEKLAGRFSSQWRTIRERRADEPVPVVVAGPSNYRRAQVPWAVDAAAAWSWRVITISAAIFGTLWLLSYFAVIVFPLIIALLITALVSPLVRILSRFGLGRRLASLLVVVISIALIGLLLTFVSSQIANGFDDLSKQVVDAVGQLRDWLSTGPLGLSDADLQNVLKNVQDQLGNSNTSILGRVTEVGATVGHVLAGFFIILFATYFFLADGDLIWAWIVRLFPRVARVRADTSGKVAWHSLTQFVRATMLIAATDALGIMAWAAVLKVPFVLAIGVLVFLGAFVPMIGATVSGFVAVAVALVTQGPVTALLMLIGVIVVQQIEAHGLQPFLMGRFVSVHPLGVIIAIGCGVLVAGVAGALIAVPFAAALNAVFQHLASATEVGEDAEEATLDDDVPPGPELVLE